MLDNYFIEKLLGLKDLILLNIEDSCDSKIIEFKMKQKIHKCPVCHEETSKVHDYRIQNVKDIPILGMYSILKIHKRRYVCKSCGKKFYENTPFLPKYQRTSNRLWMYVLKELDETRSMKSIGKSVNLSGPTIARIIDQVNYSRQSLPQIISIDEFKGNAGTKYQCILTNPKKKQVLDILPERNLESLCSYFSGFDNRKDVKYVVMDMSSLFRSMAQSCFPKASIVADKYHVYRQVQWAFEDVRKEAQKDFSKSRRRYFKRSRTLLLKGREKLKEDELEQISQMLYLSKPLSQAYYLLHEFREFMHSQTKAQAKERLSRWNMHVGVTDLERFHKCLNTFTDWNEEILNAFETGLTNGYTEGCNNKIKVLKRNAYGVRRFDRFRKRILHVMNSPT